MWFLTSRPLIRNTTNVADLSTRQNWRSIFEEMNRNEYIQIFDVHCCFLVCFNFLDFCAFFLIPVQCPIQLSSNLSFSACALKPRQILFLLAPLLTTLEDTKPPKARRTWPHFDPGFLRFAHIFCQVPMLLCGPIAHLLTYPGWA